MTAVALLAASALSASAAPAPVVISTAIVAAEQRLLDRCAPSGQLDVGAVLASPAGRRDLDLLDPGEVRDLISYSACRELQGAADGCSSLGGLGGGRDANACRQSAAQSRFAFQIFRGGDAAGACLKLFAPEGKRGPSVERVCASVIAAVRAGKAASVCPELKQQGLFGPNEDCVDALSSWNGKTADCVRVPEEGARRDCRERGALVAGLRDAGACSTSAACRALSGKDPRACDGLLSSLSRSVCARMAKAVTEAPAQLAAQEKLQREADARRGAEAKARLDAAIKAKADAQAVVKAKADAEGRIRAQAEAKKAARAAKHQFRKGEPMRQGGGLQEIMKKMEKGVAASSAPATGGIVAPQDGDGGDGGDGGKSQGD